MIAKTRDGVIRILLVDDHSVVREGIRSALDKVANMRIVGEAGDGKEALRKARALHPDVILLDLSLPKTTGLETIRGLRKAVPRSRILVFTMHEDREHAIAAVRAGARGYVVKDSSLEILKIGIETVSQGREFYCPVITKVLLVDQLRGRPASRRGRKKATRSGLTKREEEVLILVAKGFSNKEIAEQLTIGVRTVETHRERLMRKLGVNNVAGLTRYAIMHGLVKLR